MFSDFSRTVFTSFKEIAVSRHSGMNRVRKTKLCRRSLVVIAPSGCRLLRFKCNFSVKSAVMKIGARNVFDNYLTSVGHFDTFGKTHVFVGSIAVNSINIKSSYDTESGNRRSTI